MHYALDWGNGTLPFLINDLVHDEWGDLFSNAAQHIIIEGSWQHFELLYRKNDDKDTLYHPKIFRSCKLSYFMNDKLHKMLKGE